MAERIQRRREKGWRMPQGCVYVGRPTIWGNPWHRDPRTQLVAGPGWYFSADPDGTRLMLASMYRSWLHFGSMAPALMGCGRHENLEQKRQRILDRIYADLRGRDMACWCPLVDEYGQRVPCHADVLLELANGAR